MASHGVPIKARHSSVTSNNEVRHMFSRAKCAVAIAALLVGAGTASAQGTRQRITAGPHGGIRSVTQSRGNGQFTGTRQAVGPHGAAYTNQRSVSQGHSTDTRSVTGPNGATSTTQRTAGNGEQTSSKTVTGQ